MISDFERSFKMVLTRDFKTNDSGNPRVRICEIARASVSCGFNLTKSKWDPYPWVSNVECGSPAEIAGVLPGDCLLEVNGENVLGLRVAEVANKIKARSERVTIMLWNSGVGPNCTPETLCCGPMPTNLQRLSSCMNNILAALECPVCLDTIPPPAHQCANGHLICLKCRIKTEKCPVCRLKLFRGRSLLSDQVYNALVDAFDLKDKEESKQKKMLKQKMMGHKNGPSKNKLEIKINFLNVPTNKILSRFIKSGKSSSAENLTESNDLKKNSNFLNVVDNFHLGLRAKSLSSNEILGAEKQQDSKMCSGNDFLHVSPMVFYERPASYHGSVEDLEKRLLVDFEFDESLSSTNKQFYCPCDKKCREKISFNNFFKHIQECHEGPILHFFKPYLNLSLPLLYESTTVLIISSFGTIFIVKILDYSCKSKDNRLWLWSLKSKQDFTISVTLEENKFKTTLECPVHSIEKTGWQDIDENYGVPLNITNGFLKLQIKFDKTS